MIQLSRKEEEMGLIEIIFEINLGSILVFLGGIVSGAILTILIYLLCIVSSINKQEVIITNRTNDISKEEIVKIIEDHQKEFLKIRKEKGEITFDSLKNVTLDLMTVIAKHYYPESKNPLSELTIKELILLDKYLVEKLESILDKVGLRFLKKLKMSTILNILNMKKTIDNNSVVKVTKNVSRFSGKIWTLLNILNPITWIKKGIINPSINLITKKICLLIIASVGEETYRIYSKQAFLDPLLDKEVEALIEIIEKEHDPQLIQIESHTPIKTIKSKKKIKT